MAAEVEPLAGSTGALLSGLGRLLDGNRSVFILFWVKGWRWVFVFDEALAFGRGGSCRAWEVCMHFGSLLTRHDISAEGLSSLGVAG